MSPEEIGAALGKGAASEEEAPDSSVGDVGKKGRVAAARLAISAMKSGDADAFASALEDFVALCEGGEDY